MTDCPLTANDLDRPGLGRESIESNNTGHPLGEWCNEITELGSALKGALRRLASTIAVVTMNVDGARAAIAVTSVAGLTLDPPSLLVCINRAASIRPALQRGAAFCVNLLGYGNLEVARCCAGPSGTDRFQYGTWLGFADRTPYLADAQANLHCIVAESFEYGTHEIVIGNAEAIRICGKVAPLVYVDGQLAKVEDSLVANAEARGGKGFGGGENA